MFSALKIFSKYKQRCFIKIHIARGKNARQCQTALLEACGIVPWLGAYAFHRGRKEVHQCHTAATAVEQSVRRLV